MGIESSPAYRFVVSRCGIDPLPEPEDRDGAPVKGLELETRVMNKAPSTTSCRMDSSWLMIAPGIILDSKSCRCVLAYFALD